MVLEEIWVQILDLPFVSPVNLVVVTLHLETRFLASKYEREGISESIEWKMFDDLTYSGA